LAARDHLEADSLFDLLEQQIVPLFHDRRAGVPRGWLRKVKHDLASLGPAGVASRMVRDYTGEVYQPTAPGAEAPSAEGGGRGQGGGGAGGEEVGGGKGGGRAAGDGVAIESIDADADLVALGAERQVSVQVALGSLTPNDVVVQVVHGRVGQHDELLEPAMVSL